MGCHHFDAAFRALKLGHPTSVHAVSTAVNKETYPLASIVRYDFPARGNMPAVKLTWYDGGLTPPRPRDLEMGAELGESQNGLLFVGDDGAIVTGTAGRKPRLVSESKMRAYRPPDEPLPRSPGHWAEWIAACKGGPAARSNFDHAGPLTETVLLGCLALRPELRETLAAQSLEWDGPGLKFTNCPEANEFLNGAYQPRWTL